MSSDEGSEVGRGEITLGVSASCHVPIEFQTARGIVAKGVLPDEFTGVDAF